MVRPKDLYMAVKQSRDQKSTQLSAILRIEDMEDVAPWLAWMLQKWGGVPEIRGRRESCYFEGVYMVWSLVFVNPESSTGV